MTDFPRTQIDGLSVSRMIIGTNWFLGYSHTTSSMDRLIRTYLPDSKSIAEILEVFLRAGVDTLMGPFRPFFDATKEPEHQRLLDGIRQAEQRVGRPIIKIATPRLIIHNELDADSKNAAILDRMVEFGAKVCMPHTSTTDALVDVRSHRIIDMDKYCGMICERGMIPGLSTHKPESIVYADESGLDVATYLSIYNAAGFLMHLEVDWTQRLIWQARKPVITIKPMAAGRLTPLVGLAFAWSTIRDIDMVTVGTMMPDQAREVIEISLSVLERRGPMVKLQRTRSKETVES